MRKNELGEDIHAIFASEFIELVRNTDTHTLKEHRDTGVAEVKFPDGDRKTGYRRFYVTVTEVFDCKEDIDAWRLTHK